MALHGIILPPHFHTYTHTHTYLSVNNFPFFSPFFPFPLFSFFPFFFVEGIIGGGVIRHPNDIIMGWMDGCGKVKFDYCGDWDW